MKVKKLTINKLVTVQRVEFSPITTTYTVESELEKDEKLEDCKRKLDEIMDDWILFDIFKWTNPGRAITKGKKLGIYSNPKKDPPKDEEPF